METSVGENEWREQGKDNGRKRRSWWIYGYYLCPYTSREQEVPNPSSFPDSTTLPLCHIRCFHLREWFHGHSNAIRARAITEAVVSPFPAFWLYVLVLPPPLYGHYQETFCSVSQLSELIWLQIDPFLLLFSLSFSLPPWIWVGLKKDETSSSIELIWLYE